LLKPPKKRRPEGDSSKKKKLFEEKGRKHPNRKLDEAAEEKKQAIYLLKWATAGGMSQRSAVPHKVTEKMTREEGGGSHIHRMLRKRNWKGGPVLHSNGKWELARNFHDILFKNQGAYLS